MPRRNPALKAITSGYISGTVTAWLNQAVAAWTQQAGGLVVGDSPTILIVPNAAYELHVRLQGTCCATVGPSAALPVFGT
jgi:hypothetical protein